MQALLNTAIKAAHRGGDMAARQLKRVAEVKIETKGVNDFVTRVDRAVEDKIIETIREYYPEHAFLAEESGATGGGDFVWIIDPIDGTTNFIHGLPIFAVSIALRVKGRIEVGVVYDPNRQEIFTAIRGRGAQMDGHKIRVSGRRGLDGALIGTGFPFRLQDRVDTYVRMLASVLRRTAGVRRPGAAALDLAWLAAGRYDGFWEFGLSPWDIAAGSLLVREAGGLISELDGDGDYLASGNVVAGTPKVHDALRKLLLAEL